MDDKLMEFWGNFLLNAARGKKQMDEMSSWMKDGFGEMSAMFKNMNEMYKTSEHGDDYNKATQKMSQEFRRSLKEYLALMGMVPSDEHLELVEKYEKLKEKCNNQEETISHLKMLLTARDTGQQDVVTGMRDIAKNQTEFFRKMMDDFGKFMGEVAPDPSNAEAKETGETEKSEVQSPASDPDDKPEK